MERHNFNSHVLLLVYFSSRAAKRTKAIACLLTVNYSRQQDLFMLCTKPVFAPHALHKTAVTKVTATPTVTAERDKQSNVDNEAAENSVYPQP